MEQRTAMIANINTAGDFAEAAVTPWLSGIRAILYLALEWTKQSLTYERGGFRKGTRLDKP